MKKHFLTLFLLVILVQLAGCNKMIRGSGHVVQQTVAVDTFTAIEIEGSFEVSVQQNVSPSGLLVMEAEDNIAPLINVRIVNRVLKIRYSTIDQIQTKKTPKIFLNTAALTRLYINGSGSIQTSGSWEGTELELRVNGSGDIITNQRVQTLQTSVNGSGNITVAGRTVVADSYISGSGNIHAAALISEKTRAELSGSGTIYCGVVEKELDMVVSGSGKIYYSGNPGVIRTRISGNGQIIRQ
jgi:predicted small secreted protein